MEKLFFLGILICQILMFVSCGRKETIKNELEKFERHQIVCPLDSMQVRYSDNFDKRSIKSSKYKVIVYIDSTRCSPCSIDGLFHWNRLINVSISKKEDIRYVFIVAPRKSQIEDTYLSIDACGLKAPIYVDLKYSFRRNNKYLPSKNDLHVFLIDGKGNVLVVGNLLRNKNIEKLYKRVISPK